MEPIRHSTVVVLEDQTQVAVARRAVFAAAEQLDLGPEATSRAEIVAVEFANNILQHAKRGEMIIGSTPDAQALQMVAIDKGPGIASVERALQDGFSTANTPGTGLGAASRMAQRFSIFSELGKGTVASACIAPLPSRSAPVPAFSTAVLSTSIHGETLNGDSWATFTLPDRDLFFLVDGLGHGLYASEAAGLATRLFLQAHEQNPAISLSDLLQRMQVPMHATRGAAVATVAIDRARRTATCCGVGNVTCVLCAPDGTARSLVSHNGTLGHQMRRVQEFHYPFVPGSILVMHSDGLATHWKLSQYRDLLEAPAASIAGVLYRDAVRGRDDATVLVSRLGSLEVSHA